MFKRDVLSWNKGRRVAVFAAGHGRKHLRPAKRRSTDLNVYPQFVFHTANELSLSSPALCVSVLRVWTVCTLAVVCASV